MRPKQRPLLFLALFMYVFAQNSNSATNPCPHIVIYSQDNGRIFAYVVLTLDKQEINYVTVEFTLLTSFEDGELGTMALEQDDASVVRQILRGQAVYYRVNFPRWEDVVPKFTAIHLNGRLVCSGPGVGFVEGKTTKTVTQQATFTIRNFNAVVLSANAFPPPRPESPKIETRAEEVNTDDEEEEDELKDNAFLDGGEEEQNWRQICGTTQEINALVFGGTVIPRGRYPWLTALFVKQQHGWSYKCVGSLVTDRHVVTAGHCTEDEERMRTVRGEHVLVGLGCYDIDKFPTEKNAEYSLVDAVHVHPDYSYGFGDADIALMTMRQPVRFTLNIRPICLWPADAGTSIRLLIDIKGAVTGWGLDESNEVSHLPKEVHMPIASTAKCLESNANFASIVSERTFCAGNRDGIGPCNGDSGSAFAMLANRRWYLRGVVAVSLKSEQGSCDLKNYVVFADAPQFDKWIRDIIDQN